ncbi:MAG TPA: hypothetical protein VG015_08785, partial [Candidatus Dormibacteraeota bacterium]|nr:hypothetical protein [Candidatus Dormibacteraeota bacterium]
MRDRPGPGTDNGFKVLVLVVGAVVGGGWVLHHPPATMMAGVGIAILIGIGGASLALLIFLVVVFAKIARWLRADGETRKSLRQARQIQKGWPRLSRQLGLATADPDHLVPAAGPGTRTRPFIWTPQIKVRADAYGVVVTAATLPRLHRGVWVKAADDLANAWGCVRVAVSQDRPGWVTLRAVRRDPLTEAYRYAPTGHPPAELERWMMGRDEYSADVWVRLADVPGICIAGLPGYGKTSLVNSL